MITKAHITRRAAQDNVPAVTVERDYVLAEGVNLIWTVISKISSFSRSQRLTMLES
jgi:hypothetical protein